MQIATNKAPQSITPLARHVRTSFLRDNAMSTDNSTRHPPTPTLNSASPFYRLTEEEGEKFLRIVSGSRVIRRHHDLFVWLAGELQEFLPHDIFISACGDFDTRHVKLDIVSALPGVRTARLADCGIDELVEELHLKWVAAGRHPLLLRATDVVALLDRCPCPLHSALRSMQSLLVHGIQDVRDGYDSLYLAFGRSSFTKGRCKKDFFFLLDLLIPQIDIAYRRVATWKTVATRDEARDSNDWLNLSARELEVLELICRGDTNVAIGQALNISPLTVKNHLQRIFKKIGVSNRTQAATKYHRSVQALRGVLAR
jgi:transcriptional regulator EpsA